MDPAPLERSSLRWRVILIAAASLTLSGLELAHVHGMNGPWWWVWTWRRLSLWLYPALLLAAIPFFAGQWVYQRIHTKRGLYLALGLVMLGTLSLELTAMAFQPLGLRRVTALVRSSVNTSYYDAAKVMTEQMDRGASYRDWLEIYPQLMPKLMLHAGYKPPGLILYYIFIIRVFGIAHAATVAGWIIAVLACVSVGATYGLLREMRLSQDAAFAGASLFAATPSLIGFLPQVDQAYPILAAVLLITWMEAMRRHSAPLAMAFGAWLGILLFVSPTFLMFGAFLGLYTLLRVKDREWPEAWRAGSFGICALLSVMGLYIALWFAFGYDPFETFRVAASRSQAHLISLQRPWPLHSLFDVIDIALGTGWISFPLTIMGMVALYWSREGVKEDNAWRLASLGLVQVALAVAVAVFPGENARLMLPFMPLLLAPAGAEVARWPARWRMIVYLLMLLALAVFIQNMIPLYLGPEIEGVVKI